jgi:hypothetical protein
VYALFGVVLIPVSFLAIRLAKNFIHPVVFTSQGPQMTHAQFLTFCVSWAAMLCLFATLYHVELAGKRIDSHLRELRELVGRRLDGGPQGAKLSASPTAERGSA